MSKCWQYHRGEWTEVENAFPICCVEHVEEALGEPGFDRWGEFGATEHGIRVVLYRTDGTQPWRYYAIFTPRAYGVLEKILITDLPSALQFIKEFTGPFQAPAHLEFVQGTTPWSPGH